MTTVLDQTSALQQLADLWEGDAEVQKRYDPDDPKAKILERCAADVRRLLGEHTPEWIPIRTVHTTTGRSLPWLRRRCEELQALGQARKDVGGRWEISLQAALDVPVNRDRVEIGPDQDIDALARLLGRGGG